MIQRFPKARLAGAGEVVVWGTGTPRREFLYVGDLADACLFLMENYQEGEIINIGTGQELTIRELAQLVVQVVGFPGQLVFDPGYPDGTPRKLLDISRLANLGWQARMPLIEGLVRTYEWYCASAWVQK